MKSDCGVVWFRQDLRLGDNPALTAALKNCRSIIPVYIWSPEDDGAWPPGAASRWWLHQSLEALDESLRARGSRLILRSGPAVEVLAKLVSEAKAQALYFNHRYEINAAKVESDIHKKLAGDGVDVQRFRASLLFDPEKVFNLQGKPFQVFTQYWRKCLTLPEPAAAQAAPKSVPEPKHWPTSEKLSELKLKPEIDWAGGFRDEWQPGENGAQKRLKKFLSSLIEEYDTARDIMSCDGTSKMSPHLHFGEISPRQIWHAVKKHEAEHGGTKRIQSAETYLREIGWREFSHYMIVYFPKTPTEPLRDKFAKFPWRYDKKQLRAWQRGRTGYPLIDAGMRQLWHTGWMHNRVRMNVASFLVKHLLLPWQEGAKWFWDTLVDADLANNTMGWQWTAGCGPDAAPYFRIFNPVLQGEKFDPDGEYVKRWVSELAKLPREFIHKPWEAPDETLKAAGVKLGENYPRPIVEHAFARERALDAFASLK